MKNTQIVAERIKIQAKEKGISVKKLLEKCELGVNTVTKMSNGTDIVSQNLLKIADCLECSVDYLLGRTSSPSACFDDFVSGNVNNISNSHVGAVGNTLTGTINIGGGDTVPNNEQKTISAPESDEITSEIVRILDKLPLKERSKLMTMIYDFEEDYDVKKKQQQVTSP